MGKTTNNLLSGTLDLLILRALQNEQLHGWGIQQRINQIAKDTLLINQGSLYPALVRLERQSFIDSKWRITESNRRAKYYHLTAKGRKQLEVETRLWKQFTSTVNLILGTI